MRDKLGKPSPGETRRATYAEQGMLRKRYKKVPYILFIYCDEDGVLHFYRGSSSRKVGTKEGKLGEHLDQDTCVAYQRLLEYFWSEAYENL